MRTFIENECEIINSSLLLINFMNILVSVIN